MVLPEIIDESQSSLVSNRLITNNVILAFEVFHWMNIGNQHNNEHMAIKLDIRHVSGWNGLIWRGL